MEFFLAVWEIILMETLVTLVAIVDLHSMVVLIERVKLMEPGVEQMGLV